MAQTLTGYLVEDHRRLERLLERAVGGEEIDLEAYRPFRAGLLRHIGIEEKLLFPEAWRRRSEPEWPEVQRLRVEHAAITSLMVPTPDRALVADVQGLLAGHDVIEEGPGGVYAECERLLGEDSAALAEQARAFPEVPVKPFYDGPRAVRTASEALATARKMAPLKRR